MKINSKIGITSKIEISPKIKMTKIKGNPNLKIPSKMKNNLKNAYVLKYDDPKN